MPRGKAGPARGPVGRPARGRGARLGPPWASGSRGQLERALRGPDRLRFRDGGNCPIEAPQLPGGELGRSPLLPTPRRDSYRWGNSGDRPSPWRPPSAVGHPTWASGRPLGNSGGPLHNTQRKGQWALGAGPDLERQPVQWARIHLYSQLQGSQKMFSCPYLPYSVQGNTVAAGFDPRSYDLVSFLEVSAQMPCLIFPSIRDSGPAVSLESLN